MDSLTEYMDLSIAYGFLNKRLFSGELPDCHLTLSVKANSYGYFRTNSYQNKQNETVTRHEIALNPCYFSRDDKAVLSTLVHEMLHLWQHVGGNDSAKVYHNAEFCAKMLVFGLQCIDSKTGQAITAGQNCTQNVINNGLFDRVAEQLIETGWKVNWQRVDDLTSQKQGKGGKGKDKSKVKFQCPQCSQAAWGKSSLNILCGICNVPMTEA